MDIIVNTNLIRHAGKLLDRSSSVTPSVDHVMLKPLCPKNVPISQPFERSLPEKKGIPSFVIRDFIYEALKIKKLPLHGVTIIKDGSVICDVNIGGYDPNIYHVCHSLSKSVTATAVGMLIDEGKLSLDDKVAKLLEKRVPGIYTLGYRNLTVKHLLTMTSGASFSEVGVAVEKNWLRAYFESRVSFEPGKKFHYNSLNTYVLSAIVKEVSGEGLSKFLKRRLFDPLGITLYHWELSPEGIEAGGWGLYLRREDAAKIAQIYLNNGVWNGKRIVSESWVKTATRPHVRTPKETGPYDYGFHIWADANGKCFLFNGMFCQDVMVIKEKRIIIATNGGIEQLFQQSDYYKLIDKYFNSDRDFPVYEISLKRLLSELYRTTKKRPLFIKKRLPADIKRAFDVTYVPEVSGRNAFKGAHKVGNALSYGLLPLTEQMLRNCYSTGIRSLTLRRCDRKLFLDVEEQDGTKCLPIVIDGAAETVLKFGVTQYRAVVSAMLSSDEEDNGVLSIRIIFPEVASTRYVRLYFKDGSLLVRMNEMPGMGLIRLFADEIENGIKKNKVVADVVSLLDADSVFLKLEKRFEPAFVLVPEKKLKDNLA